MEVLMGEYFNYLMDVSSVVGKNIFFAIIVQPVPHRVLPSLHCYTLSGSCLVKKIVYKNFKVDFFYSWR